MRVAQSPPSHPPNAPAGLPAAHILSLIELLRAWGHDAERFLADAGLDEAALSAPGAAIDLRTFESVVDRARAWTGEPGLAVYLGLQMRVSAHGYVGFAAMTARTVGEALAIACRFAPIRTSALSLHLERDADRAALRIDEHADFGTARDVVIFGLVGGLLTIARALTGRPLEPASIHGRFETRLDAPPWYGRLAHVIGGPVHFGRSAHRLVFDAVVLDLPLRQSDPAALRLARAACEKALSALAPRRSLAERVRLALDDGDGGFRALPAVAGRLGLSARTLKRRLADEGASFRQVLDGLRSDRAARLLREGRTLADVAERLGYADAAGFSRAFRRWTGLTPGAWRRRAPSRGEPDHDSG